jgi:quinoprotein glucose dehydrogenase
VSKVEGPLATLHMPLAGGGSNWPGGSYDPETHTFYVFSQSAPGSLGLVPAPEGNDEGWVGGVARATPPAGRGAAAGRGGSAPAAPAAEAEGGGGLTVQGLPFIKPPYGRITAIDLNKGDIVWQIAHGETPDNIKNHPALKGLTIPRTGQSGNAGTLVTKTMVISGEPRVTTTPEGRGAMLRAYDKATGKELGAVFMPSQQSGSPMTYMLNGKQYIVVAIGGPNVPGELVAYRLPD